MGAAKSRVLEEDRMDIPETALPDRVNVLRVPLDIVPPEQLTDLIYKLLSSPPAPGGVPGKGKDIVLLSVWDLLRARRNKEYRQFVLNAGLVIPISKSLVSGSRFLCGKVPYRYMPFNFVISILGILEHREYAAYLLGGKQPSLKKTEHNLKRTFPHLRIVGRYPGSFRKQEEKIILEAIHKASPHLLLVGRGVRGGELWIARNHDHIGSGLRLWCSDIFDVFAEKKKRPSEKIFELGLESLGYCIRNPFKFFRIFLFFYYEFLLLFYRLFKVV